MPSTISAQLSPLTASAARGSFALATCTLWQREMVRFFRQRNRVVGAFATPVVFWLLLGSGLNRTFVVGNGSVSTGEDASGMGYLAYFFPGTLVMILLFTAIFSTISVIEDRREGFLQAVLVAPISRLSIALGKVLGGASIATIQGVLFLALWPLVGIYPGFWAFMVAIAVMFVLAIGLTALGLAIAWPMDSTSGFHAIMNLFLLPMWFLSGAVFPLTTAPPWLRVVMWANPLTYGNAVLAATLHGPDAPAARDVPLAVAVPVMIGFSLALVWLATFLASRPRKDGA
jgi:ABC-2 type transport system permease protein